MKNNQIQEKKQLGKLTKKLENDARDGKIDDAKVLLEKNQDIIEKLSNDHSAIIEHFYSPYSIAYKQGDIEFCRQYQATIDELTGVDSIFFVDEY